MSIITCPECGKEVSDLAEKCVNCGYPIKKRGQENQQAGLCQVCGCKNEAGTMYCKQCGIRLRDYNAVNTASKSQLSDPKLPVWKIIVLVFCCLVAPLLGIILIWVWGKNKSTGIKVGLSILCFIFWLLTVGEAKPDEQVTTTGMTQGTSKVNAVVEEDLSELVTVVEEYSYENIIGSTNYVLIVKNNSGKSVDVNINATAMDAEGKLIGAADSFESALSGGEEACLINLFSGVKGVASFSYTLSVEENRYYEGAIQDLAFEQSITDKKVIVSCTNNGKEAVEFVRAYGLFFKEGKLVDSDTSYIIDSDSELKPGVTLSKELSSSNEFDEVKVYYSGQRKR